MWEVPLSAAVIMAGGLGNRLAPHTAATPRPLVRVEDMPLLDILPRQLQRDGFARVVLALGHSARDVREFLAAGEPCALDVGRPSDYAEAQREMAENPQHCLCEDALA